MKILHVCLACFYIDNYGYQENILPKFHKNMGNEVKILASTETIIGNKTLGYIKPSTYLNSDGIEVSRVPYQYFFSNSLTRKLRFYKGIYEKICSFKPDIIFLHGIQFCGITVFAKYARKNNVLIYVDNHTDFINSCHGFFSKYILHGLIYKRCAKIIYPFVKKFYGVLPARCVFLNKVYHIPNNKIELLPLGVDDSLFNYSDCNRIKEDFRKEYNINKESFVIVSGGKLDCNKRIIELMKAFNNIDNENALLLIFGEVCDDIREEFDSMIKNQRIRYVGWINASEIYKIFFAANLGVFPGTHSVLWEEAIGCGLPCVFKKWDGFEHIDVCGNCIFLVDSSVDSIQNALTKCIDCNVAEEMRLNAEKARLQFCYSLIAKKAIEVNENV